MKSAPWSESPAQVEVMPFGQDAMDLGRAADVARFC